MFYRPIALSDNMVVNYIANRMTFADRSTVGLNVRHIMSKYNVTHHELLYMPMSAMKYKCKELCVVTRFDVDFVAGFVSCHKMRLRDIQ